MSRDSSIRIQDMLDAIAKIERYTAGFTFEMFRSDDKVVDAVLHNLMILGEAVRSLPQDLRDRHPQVPWRDIGIMRNILVHVYFGVNLLIVWDTLEQDLPVFKAVLQVIREHESA